MINPSKKIFYLILIANVLLLVICGLLIWQIGEEKTDLVEINSQIPLGQPLNSELSLGSWGKLELQLKALDNYFLSASTTVEFLEKLEGLAKRTKTSLKIDQAEAKDNLLLNLSVQGDLSSVNQFLVLLEKFPYALRLRRLDLREVEKGIWHGDFVITLMIQQ